MSTTKYGHDESKWNSNLKASIIKERKSAPVSPRFVNDVTRTPSLNTNHTSNALDQRLTSVASGRKLDLAAT